ncbi:hypothetical protein Taro_005822 [Colocasia esculenta]|uniref:SPX domain-containing protein n=1 Tax=Colocasia esculenta TaxID=4460 RepID=A0A843TU82_COLES|nr:hypothetical protein [Colocasia esculenta]
MKFGKSLSNQIEETLPEWRDKFLSYKDLKKRLKLIDPPPSSPAAASAGDAPPPAKRPRLYPAGGEADDAGKGGSKMTAEEEGFMTLLEAELDKFNTFFVEKEEEYIIHQKELQDRLRMAKDSKEEMMMVRKEIVDFHGEMVLLENYSALNYTEVADVWCLMLFGGMDRTGLVKILKKYDKRTGALIRLPFIQKVLQQPFFTTDLLNKLIKECERMLDGLLLRSSPTRHASPPLAVGAAAAAATDAASPSSSSPGDASAEQQQGSSTACQGGRRIPELEEIEYIESMYMKSTVAALRVLKDIRKGSSTVSVFSLPPLQANTTGVTVENRWPKVPAVEQTAK